LTNDPDDLSRIEKAVKRYTEGVIAEIDLHRTEILKNHPEVSQALDNIREDVEAATKLASSMDANAHVVAEHAVEKTTLAIEQLREILKQIDVSLEMKQRELPYHNSVGEIKKRIESVTKDGTRIIASPDMSKETPHIHPGGSVGGVKVPKGKYSHAWWRDVTIAGTGGVTVGVLARSFYDHIVSTSVPEAPRLGAWEDHLTAHGNEIINAMIDLRGPSPISIYDIILG
jgi:hypothetical protein